MIEWIKVRNARSRKGFTLVELLVVVGILSIVITGMLKLFLYTSTLAEISGNKTAAVADAQTKIEEIRDHNFNTITTDYALGAGNNPFPLTNLDGWGYIYFSNLIDPDLLQIEIVICWRDKYGRVIGEDSNLDGTLAPSEDLNSDNKVNSEVSLVTMLARR